MTTEMFEVYAWCIVNEPTLASSDMFFFLSTHNLMNTSALEF